MKYINADITKTKYGIIIHGCNCQFSMGAGVAKQIKLVFPRAYKEYASLKNKIRRSEKLLGSVQFVNINDDLIIGNMFTQVYYGKRPGIKYADINAIEKCLEEVIKHAINLEMDIHSVKVGCGLAGLDWKSEVLPIYERLANSYNYSDNITIYDFNQ